MPAVPLMVAAVAVLTGAQPGVAAGHTAPAGRAAPSSRSVEVRMVAVADREVSFRIEGTTTYGTVHVPSHRQGERLPAALLLPGSGPTDRDGNQPGLTPDTLADLAARLDRQRVMTLRFDKYGSGRTGQGAYAGRLADLDYPAFVRQARAALRQLALQPEVDPQRLILVGHSEGAMTALVLATQQRTAGRRAIPRISGVALLQPQAQRLLDVLAAQIHDQLAEAARTGAITPDQQATIDAAVDAAVIDFRARRPIDTNALPPALTQLFQQLTGANERFVRSDDLIDPAAVARHLPRGLPVLLTCGTEDRNVPCASTDALTTSLRRAGTARPGRIVLPGLDHLLHPIGSTELGPDVDHALVSLLESVRQVLSHRLTR
jgi:uncharacterized protein